MLKKNSTEQVGRAIEGNSEQESIYDKVHRVRKENQKKEKQSIPIEHIHPFKDNPYKVLDNAEMDELTESIGERGILTPLILKPKEDDPCEYEIISGHRRFHAAKKAGLETVPAFIYDVSKEEAAIMVVDSNLHRERILPSEKAFAYKLKYEALKRQGARTDLTSCQAGAKLRTDEVVAEKSDDSARQIQRYIRLTNLVPDLLNMMDENRIAFSVGVELSYLNEEIQYVLLGDMEELDCTPSYSQASQMHKNFVAGTLTEESIGELLRQEKPNQKETIKFSAERIRSVIPSNISDKNIENFVIKACEHYYKYLQRQKNREAR